MIMTTIYCGNHALQIAASETLEKLTQKGFKSEMSYLDVVRKDF